MTIKEVETLLEIPRASVRFYEKEGLISPTRSSNSYRDYSEEDVANLMKIIIGIRYIQKRRLVISSLILLMM